MPRRLRASTPGTAEERSVAERPVAQPSRAEGSVAERSVAERIRRGAGTALLLALGLGLAGVMLALASWQWGKARAQGSVLNYSYAVEWLLFAVLTVIALVWLVREGRRGVAASSQGAAEVRADASAGTPAGVRTPLVGPPLRPGEELEELTWVRLRRRLGLEGRRAAGRSPGDRAPADRGRP